MIRRRWRRWVVLAGLIGALAWLNGPGLRWLGPKVALHFLSKTGLRGSFVLEGNLVGGFSARDLRLEGDKSGALLLTIDSLTPEYRFSHLFGKRLDGIVIEGLHADLRLGLQDEKPEDEKEPLDLDAMAKNLRAARDQLIPLNVDFKDLSLNVSRKGASVFSLAPTRIRHTAGESDITLDIGVITDASGREWPAHESSIDWTENALMIDRLDPLPGLGVRQLVVNLPENGSLSVESEVHIDDAVFLVDVSPGLTSAQVNLREGSLPADVVAAYFGLKLPFSGELNSFSASVDNLLPDPMAATGSVQLFVGKLAYDGWRIPELSLDATLESARATLAARAETLGTEVAMDADAGVIRTDGKFLLGESRGSLHVAEVPGLVAALAERIEAINPDAPVPASMIDGDFRVTFSNNRPQSADVNLTLKPADVAVASPLSVKARWQPEAPVSARVELDGMTADAAYDFEKAIYQGHVVMKDFASARIDPWLDLVKSGTGRAISISGDWRGGGSVKDSRHHGSLDLSGLHYQRDGLSPVSGQGLIDYNWPDGFTTKGLQVKAADQSIAVDLLLADGFLQMTDLLWRDGDKEMAAGSAKLPVPQDMREWREMLARDERTLVVAIDSRQLSLASLKDWFPQAGKIDPRSTGRMGLKISGTYAKPVIDAELKVTELRAPEQPKLPPADLKVNLAARDGRISLDGSILTPDFPPAVMTASMPFRPAEWARNPELISGEKISARIDLPRIDLSRFMTLVPGAKKLSGNLTGNLEAAGEIRKPVLKGTLYLTNGGLEMERPDFPPVAGLAASFDLTQDKITLRELKATVAGGTLAAAGSLALANGKPGAIEFRVKGDHLPLKRDESLIVRANTDLRLSGSWNQAALKGTVGLVDSIFYRDIELLPIGSPFTGPSAASLPKIDAPAKPAESVPAPLRDWTLDIGVKTENPFLIRGNLASGKVAGKLRIGGTIGDPAPDGDVRISNFRASLPFSTLEVNSGILRFTPGNGFDPTLEIRGTSEPRPYRVSVFVYGQASDPQMILTSSPPLPENEIMTLLATGTTTSGLEDPQTASTRALQLFAEELRRGRFAVGKQLRPLLGLLDRVDFSVAEADPYSSEAYSTATLRITDRWYLSAGMGGEGDSRVLGIWRLRFY